jgi:hypothetical protein
MGGGSRCRGGFAQDLKHHCATGRAFALDGLAAILHGFFNAIGDGLLGLALDAVSFRHKKFTADTSCIERLHRLPANRVNVNSKWKLHIFNDL